MIPLRYRLRSVIARIPILSIVLIAAGAALVYSSTQSWPRTAISVCVMIAIGFALRFSTFIVDWLTQAVSPNSVNQLDHRRNAVRVEFAKWDQLELNDVERFQLALWLGDHKPPRWMKWLNFFALLGLLGFSLFLHVVLRIDETTAT
jgi:hypothetical protein